MPTCYQCASVPGTCFRTHLPPSCACSLPLVPHLPQPPPALIQPVSAAQPPHTLTRPLLAPSCPICRPWSSRASPSPRPASSRSCRRAAQSSLPPTPLEGGTTPHALWPRTLSCRTPFCRGAVVLRLCAEGEGKGQLVDATRPLSQRAIGQGSGHSRGLGRKGHGGGSCVGQGGSLYVAVAAL